MKDYVLDKKSNGEVDLGLNSLKYILICFVVFGHTISKYGGEIEHIQYIKSMIGLFHMPLFIMISGYLSRKKSNNRFVQSIIKLFIPLIVFQIISGLLKWMFQGFVISFLQPYWTLWYLLSLIYWRTLIQILPVSVLQKKNIVVFACIFFSLFSALIPLNYKFSFMRTFSFLPFFMFGYYLDANWLNKIRNIRIAWLLCLILIYVVATVFLTYILGAEDIKILYTGARCYSATNLSFMQFIIFRLLCFAVTMTVCIGLLGMIKGKISWISKEGEFSMSYYLYHAIIIEFILCPIAESFGLGHDLVTILFLTLINLAFLSIISRIRFFKKLMNPLT